LPTEQLRLVAFSAVRLELLAGQVLFRAGDRAMSGYVVSSGALELSVRDGERTDVVATCEAGSLIGEIALFVENKRPATATAKLPSQVLEIDRKLITRMLNEYPHIAVSLRTTLADRLSATVSELGKVRDALQRIERPTGSRRLGCSRNRRAWRGLGGGCSRFAGSQVGRL
jgi:CRP-like cAMP-binding protein